MARPWGRPPEGLLTEPDGVLQVEPADVRPPRQVEVEVAGAGPPQPQHLGRARAGGDAFDLDADDRAAHDRSRPAGAVAGVALLLGMQPRPGLHGHGAVLVVLADQGGGRGRPGGRVGTVELGAVAARPTALGGARRWWWVAVEAAVGAEPHQHGCWSVGEVQGELGRVVAAVEHEHRHRPADGQAAQQRADLYGSLLVGVVQGMQPASVDRGGP